MDIITNINLLGEKEISYFDFVAEKEIRERVPNFTDSIETARKKVIYTASIELSNRFEHYYHDLLKFADIKGKHRHNIVMAVANLHRGSSELHFYYDQSILSDMCAHIYEKIIPYLATCTIKSDKYFRLLHILENQCLKFSSKHQLTDENLISTTH